VKPTPLRTLPALCPTMSDRNQRSLFGCGHYSQPLESNLFTSFILQRVLRISSTTCICSSDARSALGGGPYGIHHSVPRIIRGNPCFLAGEQALPTPDTGRLRISCGSSLPAAAVIARAEGRRKSRTWPQRVMLYEFVVENRDELIRRCREG
jgi:hypothetical protein